MTKFSINLTLVALLGSMLMVLPAKAQEVVEFGTSSIFEDVGGQGQDDLIQAVIDRARSTDPDGSNGVNAASTTVGGWAIMSDALQNAIDVATLRLAQVNSALCYYGSLAADSAACTADGVNVPTSAEEIAERDNVLRLNPNAVASLNSELASLTAEITASTAQKTQVDTSITTLLGTAALASANQAQVADAAYLQILKEVYTVLWTPNTDATTPDQVTADRLFVSNRAIDVVVRAEAAVDALIDARASDSDGVISDAEEYLAVTSSCSATLDADGVPTNFDTSGCAGLLSKAIRKSDEFVSAADAAIARTTVFNPVDQHYLETSVELLNGLNVFHAATVRNKNRIDSTTTLSSTVNAAVTANRAAITANTSSIQANATTIASLTGELAELKQALALSMALAITPEVQGSKYVITVAGGSFESENAFAVSANFRAGDNMVFGVGAANNKGGTVANFSFSMNYGKSN